VGSGCEGRRGRGFSLESGSRSKTTDDLAASFNIAVNFCLRIAGPDDAVLPVSMLKILSA
jgi:hypothetical protein